MLHRLAELGEEIGDAYAAFDYARVVARAVAFMNADLSAFYFDIRKDALYCDPPSSLRRRGALEAIEQIFRARHALAGADPRLHRRGGLGRARPGGAFGPSRAVPGDPAGLARRRARGEMADDPPAPRSSSPARSRSRARTRRSAPRWRRRRCVFIADPELAAALDGVDFAEVCITSDIAIEAGRPRRPTLSGWPRCPASPSSSSAPRASNARARGDISTPVDRRSRLSRRNPARRAGPARIESAGAWP